MAPTMEVPYSREAEESVVGAMLARPKVIADVVATMLQPGHFFGRGLRVVFDELVDSYYRDGATDALTIAQRSHPKLPDPHPGYEQFLGQLRSIATTAQPNDAEAHAKLVKRDADRRRLTQIGQHLTQDAVAGITNPEELAAQASQEAMEVATATLLTNEIISYGDLGRRFVHHERELMAARAAGIEVGVFFGLRFLDERIHGLKPTEFMILAGEPGVGKSGVAWCASRQFADRQLKKPVQERIGTFVLSLEMGETPSSMRLAQSEGLVDGAKLRDGSVTEDELARIIKEWGAKKDAPLYFNFTSMLRGSQLRALVVEAIRRYQVGLVVIDHMRYFDADRRFDNTADEDEAKARFLKEQIAKDLNVAVLLLAHTTKAIEHTEDRRPRLSHLRGGGMVAAHADCVAFLYHPYVHASEADILEGDVVRTDYELIWAKNRHGLNATSRLHFNPSTMYVRDRI